MKITRLLLGVIAPLALAVPALAEQPTDGAQPAQTEAVGEPGGGAPAAAPAAQPAPRARHTVALGPEGTDENGRTGRIHTVVRGDTLWDISEAYLGTPWVWPTIWKENPRVANPNRIYPGNRLWIAPGEMRQLSDAEAASLGQPPASSGDVSSQPTGILVVPGIDQIDFIDAQHLETAGALLGSPEREKMLSANRRAYVGLGEGQVEVGDRFSIVREAEKVRDPETNKLLGYHVDKLGWLEITKVDLESSEALIRESWGDILRGDRLVPLVEPSPEIGVRPSTSAVEGQLAMLPDNRTVTAHYDTVYLNRGTDHGLEVGNPIEVYEPGAIVRDEETKIDHRMPDDVIANLIVITVQPETSVALVTHVNKQLHRGDMFRPTDNERSSFRGALSEPLDSTQWTARTLGKGGSITDSPPAKAAQP